MESKTRTQILDELIQSGYTMKAGALHLATHYGFDGGFTRLKPLTVDDLATICDYFYRAGVEDTLKIAEKDLALTPEDVVTLVNLYELGKEKGETIEEILKHFNKQRKK